MTSPNVSFKFTKGQEITKIRKKLDITRKEFSDALGLSVEEEKKLMFWETDQKEIPDKIYKKILAFPTNPPFVSPSPEKSRFTQIDLFAGIGGIRLAFQRHGGRTVFSSEWDKFAQKTYRINYGEIPHGDITQIHEKDIPDHDILLAGFPCQPFSQAGLKKGFEDARGTLFFDIARILKEKRPKAFLLENVKQLRGHDGGKTLSVILSVLEELEYYVPTPQVLNALDFGIPQNRERIIIVGFDRRYLKGDYERFKYPKGNGNENIVVGNILQNEVCDRFTISDKLYQGHLERKKSHKKKGNGFGFCLYNSFSPYTSTISARYYKDGSEALIEQIGKNPRMLTPRECARLQGFPEEFVIPVSNSQAYKQFGNSVCVKVIDAVAKNMIEFMEKNNMLSSKNNYRGLEKLFYEAVNEEDKYKKGKMLESLMKSFFSKVDGFVVETNMTTKTEEIDLVINNESKDMTWGKESLYLIGECKNWNGKVGKSELVLFNSKLSNRKDRVKVGFFISINGFTETFKLEDLRSSKEDTLIITLTGEEVLEAIKSRDINSYLKEKHKKSIFK